MTVDLYEPLTKVLRSVYDRAASGKGAQRHGGAGIPFLEQPIFTITKSLGNRPDPLLFQAVKKIYESQRLSAEAAVNELEDAIVYIAAACIIRNA